MSENINLNDGYFRPHLIMNFDEFVYLFSLYKGEMPIFLFFAGVARVTIYEFGLHLIFLIVVWAIEFYFEVSLLSLQFSQHHEAHLVVSFFVT